MGNYKNLNIRQSQLIRPFGVGAIHTLPGNTSYVTGSLKYWFRDHKQQSNIKIINKLSDISNYIIKDKRLEQRLGVDHFRMPPGFDNDDNNPYVFKIPLYRFPTWYVCSNQKCSRLERKGRTQEGLIRCSADNCNSIMSQVRFASVCPNGCLQDFPWREWVCGENHKCNVSDHLIYKSSGGASLSDIYVHCPKCSKKRSLKGILKRYEDGSTELSKKTFKSNKPYTCPSGEVWNGLSNNEESCCDQNPSGILINGLNVHYTHTISSLWIPEKGVNPRLTELSDEYDLFEKVKIYEALNIFDNYEIIEKSFEKEGIESALKDFTKEELNEYFFPSNDSDEVLSSENDLSPILYPEYECLKEENIASFSNEFLSNRIEDLSGASDFFNSFIEKVTVIDKLRETLVMHGFSRINYNSNLSYSDGFKLLWGNEQFGNRKKWLPASIVNGEGFMIYFNHDIIKSWEKSFLLSDIFKKFQTRMNRYLDETGREDPFITPKFILVHTLSHLIMKNLALNSGYDIASIKERIYCSDIEDKEMLGLMIYTASGDSQGSMGGLSKNGEIENLEGLINKSINDSLYCTNDPVCRESTEYGGQGLYGLNGASCYACTLVPETSCTHFNSFLDREVLNSFFSYLPNK